MLIRNYLYHARLAFGERAGFVDDEGVDFGERFEGFGVSNEDACMSAPADRDHDGHGGGKAEGAGAGDDQHGYRSDERVRKARLGTKERPADKRQHSGDDYGGLNRISPRSRPLPQRNRRRPAGAD